MRRENPAFASISGRATGPNDRSGGGSRQKEICIALSININLPLATSNPLLESEKSPAPPPEGAYRLVLVDRLRLPISCSLDQPSNPLLKLESPPFHCSLLQ